MEPERRRCLYRPPTRFSVLASTARRRKGAAPQSSTTAHLLRFPRSPQEASAINSPLAGQALAAAEFPGWGLCRELIHKLAVSSHCGGRGFYRPSKQPPSVGRRGRDHRSLSRDACGNGCPKLRLSLYCTMPASSSLCHRAVRGSVVPCCARRSCLEVSPTHAQGKDCVGLHSLDLGHLSKCRTCENG